MAKHKDIFKFFVPVLMALVMVSGADAAVAQRGTVSRAKVAAARAPVVSAQTVTAAVVTEPEPLAEEVVADEETFEFEDRTSQFDDAIGGVVSTGATDDDELAEMIRKQRAAADASDATTTVKQAARVSATSGQNACDMGLRKCMQSKCGADFAKCAGDTDTMWGDKLDACRRDLKCSGHEYATFASEIKADRDANAELANFNAIINCGNKYNSCIVTECGATFSKCLGKSEGDRAIAKCKKIQNECTGLDNGLASRIMNVFAGVRQDAEKQVQRDEQRLYDLRDEMEKVCRRMGALFDQRSLDCVYTVNFFANNSTTPYASKKAYAGGVFSCDPGWFGIDVTTFKENAYRLTRAQTAASSAMLGSGIGMAAGAITSGAIDRALETQKAKKELEKAEAGDDGTLESNKKDKKSKDKADDAADEDEDDNKPGAAGRRCIKAGGKWENDACNGATCDDGKKWDSSKNKCVKSRGGADGSEGADKKDEEESYEDTTARTTCDAAGGDWNPKNKKCKCKNEKGKNINTKNPSECYISTGEEGGKDGEEVVEEDDGLDTAAAVCGDKGGNWKNGKCSCKNKKGKDITTSNPVNDCVKPSEASSTEKDKKEDSAPAEEKRKKKLDSMQIEACVHRIGTLNSDSTLCSCKDRNGRSVETDNPITDCMRPKEDKKNTAASENTDPQNAGDKGGASMSVSGAKTPCDIVVTMDNKAVALEELQSQTALMGALMKLAPVPVAITYDQSSGMYSVRWNQEECKNVMDS